MPDRDSDRDAQSAMFLPVTSNFLGTMKIPLLRGRDFTVRDAATTPWVTVINETMPHRFWPNEDPIGRHVTLDLVPEERPREVIGVVRDTVRLWQTHPEPVMYVPHAQRPLHYRGPYQFGRMIMTFVVRASGDPMKLAPAVQKAVAEINPNRSLGNIRTVEQYMGQQIQEPRYYMTLLAVFAIVATVLAAIGIYGVIAFAVAQRAREIGLRMALGADKRDVLRLILAQAGPLLLSGLLVGLGVSLWITRLLASRLWGVSATDPATFGGVSLLLALVAALACFIPARRATKVDPAIALRYE